MSFSTNRFSRKALLLVTAVFSASLLWAQATGISGRVLDESGAPVIGATVMVKGTTIATATNVDGTFNLKNTGRNVTLVVSYVGYEAQQVASKGAGSVTITLKPEAIGMESVEIVSVGYGTQKRESVVGAISTIRPEALRVPVRSLAGNLAGVVALQTSGEPGKDDAQFWIRGIATFTGSPDPLILVDGIERPLNDVDPLEIESFSVLKDASATAVYGVRGAQRRYPCQHAPRFRRPGPDRPALRAGLLVRQQTPVVRRRRYPLRNVQRGGGCRECLGGTEIRRRRDQGHAHADRPRGLSRCRLAEAPYEKGVSFREGERQHLGRRQVRPLLHGPLLLQPRGAVCCQTRRIFMGERQDRPLRRECQLQAL